MLPRPLKALIVVAAAALAGCAGPGKYFSEAGDAPRSAPLSLESWPHRELWTGVVFNGDKIGFTRRTVKRTQDDPARYEIDSEAVIRLQFLGIDKRINLRALDVVRADLTLERFRYEHEIDGSPLKAYGASDGRTLEFTVEASGSREQKKIALEKPLYPSSALTLLPAIRGLAVGRRDRFLVFEGETQSIAETEQDVLAFEKSRFFEGAAFKVATRMLGLDTTTWVAPDGRPVFELAMQGVLITAAEDESTARRYLLEASLNKRDTLVDFSLVRSAAIESPRSVSRLEIALTGLPPGLLPEGCEPRTDHVNCVIDRAARGPQTESARYLKPTLAVPSNLGEIRDLARKVAGEGTVEQRIEKIVAWMDENIAKEAIDAFSALDVLRSRRAECQGHAYLFAAFARSLGIPARVVNGLVYSEPHGGFLYHSWNEAWVEGKGWQAVDATFGQPLADATHLKLLEGETPAELLPLVGLVGRLKVTAVRASARW